ncbi:glycosyltransferase family 2 protein [Sulfuricurvum sp.]|uniref:glycosyltransferase family 2 protein n=1 Tax=Sulfuricurvum sp. TaxID=2025608 RepID=UPI003BB5C1C1
MESKTVQKSFSIVIPVYNEGKTIQKVLETLYNELNTYGYAGQYEIICVNDASKDKSGEILRGIEFIVLAEHKINKGYGAALKTGIRHAKNDTIIIMDSDGQHLAEDVPKLLEGYELGMMVVGSRKITQTQKKRVLGKMVLNRLANFLFQYDIKDLNSGFRVFSRTETMRYFHVCSDRFSFTTSQTLAYLSDTKPILYTPINIQQRTEGTSSVNFKAGLRAILKVMQMGMIFKPLRLMLPMVFFFSGLTAFSLLRDLITVDMTDTTLTLFIASVMLFVFALLSDQLSTIRREMWGANLRLREGLLHDNDDNNRL